jgi:hypothetical protein
LLAPLPDDGEAAADRIAARVRALDRKASAQALS